MLNSCIHLVWVRCVHEENLAKLELKCFLPEIALFKVVIYKCRNIGKGTRDNAEISL